MSGAALVRPCIAALASIVESTGARMTTSRLFPVVTPGNAEEMRQHAAKLFERDLEIAEQEAKSLAVIAVKHCMYYRKPLTFGYGLVFSVISHYRGDWLEEGKYGRKAVEEYRAKRGFGESDVPYLAVGAFDMASGEFPRAKRRGKASQ